MDPNSPTPSSGFQPLPPKAVNETIHAEVFDHSADLSERTLRDYQLLDEIGHGGMGVVYRAEHTKLKKIVALKVLTHACLRGHEMVARFEREMAAVGQLQHPHIVQATDAGEWQDQHYLVMEYVEGIDLKQLVVQNGPLHVTEACELIRQAADGLQHAHENGLIHRDVKPGNLMLTTAGRLKILDLGLALLQETAPDQPALTEETQLLGTPEYMAPEQWENTHEVDGRVDLYALGCTLFYLLTGQPPYPMKEFNSLARMMTAHLQQPIPSVREFRPDVPRKLDSLISRLLAKQPDERVASAAEVVSALAPFATNAQLRALANQDRQAQSKTETVIQGSPDSITPTVGSSESDKPSQSTVDYPGFPDTHPSQVKLIAFLVCLSLIIGGGLWLGVVLLRLSTPQGTFVVELNGDQIEAVASGQELIIRNKQTEREYTLTINAPQNEQKLPPGEYSIHVADGSGLEIDTKEFKLQKNDKVVARITLETPAPRKLKPSVKPKVPLAKPKLPVAKQPAWKPGPAVHTIPGLIPRPAKIPGVTSWNIIPVAPAHVASKVTWSPDGKYLAFASGDGRVRVRDMQTGQIVQVFANPNLAGVSQLSWSPTGEWIVFGKETTQIVKVGGTPEPSIWRPAAIVCWSPDGQQIAGGGKDGKVRLWQLDGKEAATWEAHKDRIEAIAWSPDGKMIATVGIDEILKIWTSDGELVSETSVERGANTLSWHSENQRIAVSGGFHDPKKIGVFQIDGKPDASFQYQKIMGLAKWSPDGKWLIGSAEGGIQLLHADGRKALHFKPHDRAMGFSWALNSKQVAAALEDGSVWMYDLEKSKEELVVATPGYLQTMAVSPDEKTIACGYDNGRIRLWDAQGKGPITEMRHGSNSPLLDGQFPLRTFPIPALAWHPDGQILASGGGPEFFPYTIRLWNRDGTAGTTFPGKYQYCNDLDWSPDGKQLAMGGTDSDGHGVFILDKNGKVSNTHKLTDHVRAIAWNPQGDRIAFYQAGPSCGVWNIGDDKILDLGQIGVGQHGPSIVWDPAGQKIGVGGEPRHPIKILNLTETNKATLPSYGYGGYWLDKNQFLTVHQIDGNLIFTYYSSTGTKLKHTTPFPWPRGLHLAHPTFMDNGETFLHTSLQTLYSLDVKTGVHNWLALPVNARGDTAVFSAAGELLHGPEREKMELVYLVERTPGKQECLTPKEFHELTTEAMKK